MRGLVSFALTTYFLSRRDQRRAATATRTVSEAGESEGDEVEEGEQDIIKSKADLA